MSLIIGVDVGGTFTDFVVLDTAGNVRVHKALSTPQSPEKSLLQGLQDLKRRGQLPSPFTLMHGTTVATNALLERKGAKTAFLVTQGFRDLLFTARQNRDSLYALHPVQPSPLISREACFEMIERRDWRGEVLLPLNETHLENQLRRIKEQQYTSLAVLSLFSYLNPETELRVGEIAQAYGFESISLSSEVAPTPREYERASTTVANAFVSPILKSYLDRLEGDPVIADVTEIGVMASNGEILSPERAGRFASRTALSGPAGGVIAAMKTGEETGLQNLICFDMGGTSADVALITNGECALLEKGEIGGLPFSTPQLDILTVGAGGGSLVWRDTAGALRVGPQSAGANPGPVAYGQGHSSHLEDALTVTDANVLLGRLPSGVRLGGTMPLNAERVRAAFAILAQSTGLSSEETALGVIAICNATMTRAIRRVSVERGRHPADYWLLCYGGAGGLHACELAEATGLKGVLVPPTPGAFSALGLALADTRHDTLFSMPPECLSPEASDLPLHWQERFRTMQAALEKRFDREQTQSAERTLQKRVDLRYRGQSHSLTVSVNDLQLGENAMQKIARLFHLEHRRLYGYAMENQKIEATALRLIALEPSPYSLPKFVSPQTPGVPRGEIPFYKGDETGWGGATLYDRSALATGQTVAGAAILIQPDATTLIPPGWTGECDLYGNLRLERDKTH